jgi:hypothetical protein
MEFKFPSLLVKGEAGRGLCYILSVTDIPKSSPQNTRDENDDHKRKLSTYLWHIFVFFELLF